MSEVYSTKPFIPLKIQGCKFHCFNGYDLTGEKKLYEGPNVFSKITFPDEENPGVICKQTFVHCYLLFVSNIFRDNVGQVLCTTVNSDVAGRNETSNSDCSLDLL